MYSENNVASLKGYCGVLDPSKIPNIWDSFQQTREIASHQHNLRVSMTRWAKEMGKEIDKAPFFTEQTIKDIVGLNFNPGEAVPTYGSAQRGSPSSHAALRGHMRWRPSKTSRRHAASRPTLCSLTMLGAGSRRRPAPPPIPTLSFGSVSTCFVHWYGLYLVMSVIIIV